ncbi:MAG: hypothetical protein IPM37_09445 [Hahellaceae bacterium]|nr:hypothetical protein [Hahellaceae bacterium]
MALPLGDLPSELVRELKLRKSFVFLLFAIVSLSMLVVGRSASDSYVSRATLMLNEGAGGALAETGKIPTDTDRIERLQQALDAREVFATVAATQLRRHPLNNEEDAGTLARLISDRLIIREDGTSRLSLEYAGDSAQNAFEVLSQILELLTLGEDSKPPSATVSPVAISEDEIPFNAVATAAVDPEELESVSRQIDDRKRQIGDQQKVLASQKARRDQLVAVGAERLSALEENMADLDSRMAAVERRWLDLKVKHPESAEKLVLESELSAMSEKRRSLAVALATARAYQEKIRSPSPEELAAQAALERLRAPLKALLAQRDLLVEQAEAPVGVSDRSDSGAEDRKVEVAGQPWQAAADTFVSRSPFQVYATADYPVGKEQFAALVLWLGLPLGIATPLILIGLLCLFDPRVRSVTKFQDRTGVPVLMELPPLRSPLESRMARNQSIWYALLALAIIALYVVFSWNRLTGGAG